MVAQVICIPIGIVALLMAAGLALQALAYAVAHVWLTALTAPQNGLRGNP